MVDVVSMVVKHFMEFEIYREKNILRNFIIYPEIYSTNKLKIKFKHQKFKKLVVYNMRGAATCGAVNNY